MKTLEKLIKKIYPKEDEHRIVIDELKKILPKKEIKTKDINWYKSMCMYVVYPDSFCGGKKCGLKQLEKKIPYLHKLGVNAIHILPFLDSPQIDAGFDVSDYMNVRADVGGNKAFEQLLKKAKKYKIKILMDVVLNHISNQHEWFEKAENGDEFFRKFFITQKEKPNLIRKYVNDDGPFAQYEFACKKVDIRIIFPEFVGKIPHWVRGKDSYWYYHTFYPHQLDTNWNNPYVFVEFAKILTYWAKKGVSFRLDAIIFLGKNIYSGDVESSKKVHLFVQALNRIVKAVSKESVFLSEAVQEIDIMKRYYGTKTTVESELNYSFAAMNALWVALLTQDAESIFPVLKESWKNIQRWAGWVTFLRNHDGLTLEFADEHSRKVLRRILSKRGLPFMKGFNIAGRTMSFLANDSKKMINAHLLLASIPGSPALMYGDEIGKKNDFEFMKFFTKKKRELTGDESIVDDARDINRGRIREADILKKTAKQIYKELARIFTARQKFSKFFKDLPKEITSPKSVFAARYRYNDKVLKVYVNVGKKEFQLLAKGKLVLKTGEVIQKDGNITLAKDSGCWILE